MSGVNRAHYTGTYQRDAAAVRARANADPNTRCWQCGRTKAEHGRAWTAGHVEDGRVGGVLVAECAPCNYSRGAQLGARRRIGLTTTRNW